MTPTTKPGEADLTALPPLPKPSVHAWADISEHFLRADHYSADQMRAYALAALGTPPATPVPAPADWRAGVADLMLHLHQWQAAPAGDESTTAWNRLQATINALATPVQPVPASDEPTEAMCVAMARRVLLNRPVGGAWEDVMRLAYMDARALAPTAPAPAPATQADAAEVGQWMPIEGAPEGVLVIVGWRDEEDPENPDRHMFDYLEDGVWANYFSEHEHYAIAGVARGRSEDAPYTHWMPMGAVPAALTGSLGDGGGKG